MKLLKRTVAALALTAGFASSAAAEMLRFSSFEPPVAFLTKEVFSGWAKRVTDASGGEASVKIFAGGTLGRSPAQQLQMVADGVADIAFIVPGYNPGVFPGMTVGELPFTVTSSQAGSEALWAMYEQGMLAGDFDKYKIIGLFTSAPQAVASKSQIRMPTDMNGLNFRASSPELLVAIENMGAVPVGGITGPGVAEAISRGLIDGSFNEWSALKSFRILEAVEHVLEVPMGTSPLMIVMNKAKYESLSDKAKAAIDANSGAAFATAFGQAFDVQNDAVRADAVKAGKLTITTPDAATLAAWQQATRPSIEQWIAKTENGQAIYDAYLAAMTAK